MATATTAIQSASGRKPWYQDHPVDSCISCLAWGYVYARQRCAACYQFDYRHRRGICIGCGRKQALRKRYCRLCWSQARDEARAIDPRGQRVTAINRLGAVGCQQLFLANMVALRASMPSRRKRIEDERARRRGAPRDTPVAATTPADDDQLALFTDLTSSVRRARDNPWIQRAHQLVEHHSESRGWSEDARRDTRQALRLVLTDNTEGTPVRFTALASSLPPHNHALDRAAEILHELDLLLDDRPKPLEGWIDRKLADLNPSFAAEAAGWIRHLRDGGPRQRPLRPTTARRYANAAHPALLAWSATYGHPRQVTRDDIIAALNEQHGKGRTTLIVALKSLFAFLKKRGTIFANPTSRVRAGSPRQQVLQPLPTEAIATTTAAAHRPADPLILALASIHAARPAAIRNLRLDDLDLPNRRLTIEGNPRPLDELTTRLLLAWLDFRRNRWPHTLNPYLLINQQSATRHNPVSHNWLARTFHGRPASLDQLRIDRTLDEALANPGDALHIATMFGLAEPIAIRYAESARHLLTAAAENDATQ